jgi:drug/metabolite transporter (DMT)-like permease
VSLHAAEPRDPREARIGELAVFLAIVIFSLGSPFVRLAEAPGVVVAFWRLLLGAVIWLVILHLLRRRLSWAMLVRVAPVGVLFGANLGLFFAAVYRTRVANVEFIGAMSPFVVVPVAAVLYHERVAARGLLWGLVAVGGVAIVLFGAPGSGERGWSGDVMAMMAVLTWSGYLLVSRQVRATTAVSEVMAVTAMVAALVLLPFSVADGGMFDIGAEGWAYIVALAFLTGTVGHGIVIWAQRRVPLSTISILTLAQPALATTWAFVFLDESVRPIQVVGMVIVLVALAAFTRAANRPVPLPARHGELGGTPG